jgi:bifunctional non-homologous end joining protein LigD
VVLDGDNLRQLPLSLRKTNLARLLVRQPEGIFISDFEQGAVQPTQARKTRRHCRHFATVGNALSGW